MKKSDYRKLIAAVIGRELTAEETVHHINGNHYDDRIDNYYIFKTRRSHMLYHLKMGTLILGLCDCETNKRILAYIHRRVMPLQLTSNVFKLMCEEKNGK